MKIELSKRTKRIIYPIITVLAIAGGIVLEKYDRNDFTIEPIIVTTAPPSSTEINEPLNGGMIDVNTATKEELMTVDGIGEKTAESIIEYREQNGDFEAVEELTLIGGIGEKKLEKIKEKICVR